MTSTRPERPAPAEAGRARPAVAVVRVRRLFRAESSNYYLLLGTTVFLVVFGLVMVLSSSAIEEFRAAGEARNLGDFFTSFSRQGTFALAGIAGMLLVSRIPVSVWRRWAWHLMAGGIALQLLVVLVGVGDYNRNWLTVGPITIQPSEFVKLALCMWLAHFLLVKRASFDDPRALFGPIALVAGGAIGLVLLGNDLGTSVIMLAVVLGALLFAGVRLRYIGAVVAVVAVLALVMSFTSSSRTERITVWLNGCAPADYDRLCWQPQHGLFALAAGGVFGEGLGNSKAKWSWLPEAHNDFIFAIIGEELGMVGALVVLVLFVVLAIAFVRIIRALTDPFARVLSSAVMVWIVGQAFVNIAVVLGLLPVLGVPLPLISAGGSALIASLLAIGVVLSCARRREPV